MSDNVTPDQEFFENLETLEKTKDATNGGIQVYRGNSPIVPFTPPKNEEN